MELRMPLNMSQGLKQNAHDAFFFDDLEKYIEKDLPSLLPEYARECVKKKNLISHTLKRAVYKDDRYNDGNNLLIYNYNKNGSVESIIISHPKIIKSVSERFVYNQVIIKYTGSNTGAKFLVNGTCIFEILFTVCDGIVNVVDYHWLVKQIEF